ncbi:MAG: adenosine kinase [Lentisphaerae bacterium]|jgi:sugar/nucleoside kinase (ribokinase family)|nr:adenosine kinase [Lentisphaerota bacterium]MBT4823474.1 adenosine kinase [Lentisphaerota bacterium]MBT5606281.1 adenosine kinase [Lentisphaerota bacterium]MBT7059379.1 adenosine kinase [Lentisphaerota bacterium]MBT7848274.1 adenosine kinase [Lentisphaerota bacterium]
MHRVIGFGAALVDQLAFVDDAFIDGIDGDKGGMELLDNAQRCALLGALPSPPQRVPGGSAANTVVGLAQLGVAARLLTKVGTDAEGEFYREALEQSGVETNALKATDDAPTGTCISLVTPDSERTMRTFLGASAMLTPDDITPEDFRGCTHAHIEGYMLFNMELMLHILTTAKACGCIVSLDLASHEVVRACRPVLPGMLREYVDMVFANEDEAAAFAASGDERVALERLNSFCPLAVVKLGPRGALIGTDAGVVEVEARKATSIDTTGAGDLWAAGFLAVLLRSNDPAQAGTAGAILGAVAVEQIGAVIPEDSWPDIRKEIADLSA